MNLPSAHTPIIRHSRSLLPLRLALLAGLAVPSVAWAWSPIKPQQSCTQVPVNLLSFGGGLADADNDIVMNASRTQTTTRVRHGRYLLGNSWITSFNLLSDGFAGDAAVRFGWGWGNVQFTTAPFSGSSGFQTGIDLASVQAKPIYFELDTHGAAATSARFNGVEACSALGASPSASAPATLKPQERVKGVLLGKDDVVYAALEPNPNHHITVTMWADDLGFANDFDLYVRCGDKPTASDDGDVDGSSVGFKHLEPCSPGWVIAVTSYRGSGGFNLTYGRHRAEHHLKLRASTGGEVPTGSELDALAAELQRGALFFYGATEGDQYIDSIDFYASGKLSDNCGGFGCNINLNRVAVSYPDWAVFGSDPATWVAQTTGIADATDSSASRTSMQFWRNGWTKATMAHEFGHAYYGQQHDEYVFGSCGHSIMASHFDDNITNMCSDFDHTFDAQGSAATGIGSAMSFATAHGRTMGRVVADGTPDKYAYQHFTSKFGKVNVIRNDLPPGSFYRVTLKTCEGANSAATFTPVFMFQNADGNISSAALDTWKVAAFKAGGWFDEYIPYANVGDLTGFGVTSNTGSWCLTYAHVTRIDSGVEGASWQYVPGQTTWVTPTPGLGFIYSMFPLSRH